MAASELLARLRSAPPGLADDSEADAKGELVQEAPPPIDDLYPDCRARRLVSPSVSYRGAI